jgi:hypothetical protein
MARTIASILRDGQDPSMPALRQWLQALSTSVSATVMGFRAFPALADLNAYTPTGTEPTYAFTTDDGLMAYKYEGGAWAVDDSFYQGFGALTDPLVEELTAVTTRVSDSEAALDGLALDSLAYIGRPGEATLVNGTAKGSGAVFWHDRVDDIGELTALDVFDRAPGTINVAVYRGANETLSRVGLTSFSVTGTGAQRRYALATPLTVRAGDVLALQATDNALAVAELQSGDAGYTYASPFLPETFTLGTPSINGQMQVRFVIAYRDQVVTADRFVEAEANAVLGALASDGIDLLSADATEFIGRPGTAALVDGTATGNGSIYWRDVVDHAGTLDAIDVFAKAAGTLKVAVYRGAASALTRVALTTVATPGGSTMRALALSAPLDVLPGDILALQPQAAGLLTVAEVQSGDAGYTYSFPDLPTSIALGAPTTNGQVQVRFRVSYRKQIVTTDAFLALGETKIVGASALALSSGSRARVQIDAKVFGAKPDRFEISWRGYSVSVKSLPFVLPDQAEVKDFVVSGNSIDDATDTPKWHTILAARRGKQSHFTARYSSDGHQTFRAGLDELVFTFAGNLVAAGGTAKAIASINGNSPIDPTAGYAFLNTGDANLTTGVTLPGILIDLQTGVTRHGVASIPNAASAAYSFTQDAGLSALTLSGPALFLPDIAAEFARCDNFCGIGNNLFYSGVPNAYGDFTNASLYRVIDKFAAAAQGQRFVTRDVLPAGEWPADGSPNVIGGVDYKTHMFAAMEAWNARNEANHPGSRPRSLPTSGFPNGRTALKYLQDHGNGSSADNAAIAQGKIPISLWSDGPHPNAAGQIVLADFYQEAMQRQALGTTVTIAAFSTDAGTGEVVRSIGYAVVQLGDLAAAVEPLRSVIDTIAEEADYRPTIAAAIANFAPGKFFTSRDLDGVTPNTGIKWQYKVTAAAPYFSDEGPWSDTTAETLGVAAYVGTTPEGLPVSDQTAVELDRRLSVTEDMSLPTSAKAIARANIGAVEKAEIPNYVSRAFVQTIPIPALVTQFTVAGYNEPGDIGDASFRRVAAEPAHAGKVADAIGAWFEMTDVEARPEQFGGTRADTVALAVSDQTAFVQAAINYLATKIFGGALVLSGFYGAAGLSQPQKVRIRGRGQLVSGLRKPAAPAVGNRNTASILVFTPGASDVMHEDFSFDGLSFDDNNPLVYLGSTGGSNTTFRRVGFLNGGKQPAILGHWSAPQKDFRVEQCRFSNLPKGAIQLLPRDENARGSSGLYFERNLFDQIGAVGICIHHGDASGDGEYGFNKEIYVRGNIMTNVFKTSTGGVDLIPLEIWGWDGGECVDNSIDGGTRGLSAGAGGRGVLYAHNRISNQTMYAIECGKMRSCTIDSNTSVNCPQFAAYGGAGNDLSYDIFDVAITNNRSYGTGLLTPVTADHISSGNNAPVARNMHISGNRFFDLEYVRTVIRFLGSRAAPVIAFSGDGIGAVATATLVAVAGRIINVGSGYTSAPIITAIGGGGTGAAFTCTVNAGQIASVTMTSAGTGYTSAPELAITGGAGTGAAIDASMGIEALTITANGTGYTAATIAISNNGGSGFAGTVTVAGGAVTGVTITAPGAGFGRGSTVFVEDNRYLARTYASCANGYTIDGARVEVRRNLWRRTAPFDSAHYQGGDAIAYRIAALPTKLNDPAHNYSDNIAVMEGVRSSGTLFPVGANTVAQPYYGIAIRGGRFSGNFSQAAIIADSSGTAQIGEIDTLSLSSAASFSLNSSMVAKRVGRVIEGTGSPMTLTWRVGDKVENISTSANAPSHWRCTASGTPGIWAAVYGGGVEPVLSGYQPLSAYASGEGLVVNGRANTLMFRTESTGAAPQPQVILSVLWSGRNNNTPKGGQFMLTYGTVSVQTAPVLTQIGGDAVTIVSALDGSGRMESTITFPNSASVPAGVRIQAIRGNGTGATLAQISAQAT